MAWDSVRRSERDRDQSVEAQRDPRAVGYAGCERRQQALIHRRLRLAALRRICEIRAKRVALLAGIGEFVKAVGEFDSVQIQLEARRDRRQPGLRRASEACEAG